jgi:ABC-type proline/glycine betaine transport system ATPase subunit
MIVGLIQPNKGKIFLENEEITSLPMYKRAKLGIGYLAQEASVFRKLSVEENIMAVLEMTKIPKAQAKGKSGKPLGGIQLNACQKKLWEWSFPEEKDGGLRLPEHWLWILSLFFWMSLLQELIQLLSKKSKPLWQS